MIIIKLEELVVILDKFELVEIYINNFVIFNGKILDFEHLNYKNLEVNEIFSYGDIKDYDTLFGVMCIYCKS